MRIRRIRLRKEYRLKVWLFLFFFFSTCLIFIPQPNRALMASYFSTRCRENQPVYSKKLNDRIPDYSEQAKLSGIEKCTNARDIARRVTSRKLVKIGNTRYYDVGEMEHSYPYLTRGSKKLLRDIGKRYREKIAREGLKGSRFIITSMTRTTGSIKNLGKENLNASENSPHLYGNAFDISYARFRIRKHKVTECDKWYMKEALAEVIYDLRKEKKCWATYEKQQGCFHVVAR